MSGIGFGSIDYEGDEEDALPFEDEPADWQGYDWTPREGDEELALPPPISDDDVVAEPVDVVGGSNLVPHGSFETASGWEAGPGWQVPYAWDLTGTPAAHGTSAARISAVGIASALQSAADIPVDITRPYHISAMGMMTAYTSGEGRLVIVEYDASAQVVAETVLARQTGLSTGWVRLAGVMVVRAHSAGDHVWHPETVMVRVRLDLGGVPIFDWRVDAVVMTQGDVPMTFAPRPNEDIPGDAIIPGTVKRPQLDDVPPGTPTGLTFVPSTQTLADGTTDVIVTVTLAHPDDDDYVWSRIEITRASEGGEADPEAATPVWSGVLRGLIGKGEEQTVLHGLVGGARYWGRARAEDITGNLSDWTEAVRFDATRDLDAPPVPTDVTAIPGFRLVGLHWSPALADDLSYYEVRHRVSGSQDDWLVSRARSTSIVVTDLDPEHMYDFNVRAVDLSGQVRTSATDPRPVLATDDSVGWSEAVTAQPTLVGSSDIAANSVTATHIAAGAIEADRIGAGYIIVSTALDDRPDGIRVVTSGGLESARWDEDGLVIRETPGDIMRHVIIDGGAIRMTTDGGDLVTPQGSYQTAITPDGINASAIRLGEVPGGHNIVRNASFELNEFLTVPEEVTATSTTGPWAWNGTFRTGVTNVTEGTSLSLTKSAYSDEPSSGMFGGATLVAPPATLAASGAATSGIFGGASLAAPPASLVSTGTSGMTVSPITSDVVLIAGAENAWAQGLTADPQNTLFGVSQGSPSIETASPITGERSYRFQSAASLPYLGRACAGTDKSVIYFYGKFKLNSVPPAATTQIVYLAPVSSTIVSFMVSGSTGVLRCEIAGGGSPGQVFGPSLSSGQVCELEAEVDGSGASTQVRWRTRVAGGDWVDHTTATMSTGRTFANVRFGLMNGDTTGATVVIWDDIIIGEGTTPDRDWSDTTPKRYEVVRGTPNVDLAHSFTTGDFESEDVTPLAPSDTTIHFRVDEIFSETGTFLAQVVGGAGKYVHFGMTNLALGDPRMVAINAQIGPSAGGTYETHLRVSDDGTNWVNLLGDWGSNGYVPLTSATHVQHRVLHNTPSGDGWSEAALSGLRVQWGNSDDVSPVPYLYNLDFEAAYVVEG